VSLVPRSPSPAKFCQKCKVRKPRADFIVAADDAEGPEVSVFCETCRTTLQTCRMCAIAKPVCEFNRESRRLGRCNACRRSPVALKAALEHVQRSRLPAAGRDRVSQALLMGYEKDPDEASKRAKRRREERLRAAPRERIYRERIFERDGGICWICGEVVEPKNATLDHVVPVSLGGTDTPGNVKLAHGVCNSRRGADTSSVLPPSGSPSGANVGATCVSEPYLLPLWVLQTQDIDLHARVLKAVEAACAIPSPYGVTSADVREQLPDAKDFWPSDAQWDLSSIGHVMSTLAAQQKISRAGVYDNLQHWVVDPGSAHEHPKPD
jgi:hypothetical protein